MKGWNGLADVLRRTRGSASLLWGLSSVDCGRGDYFIFLMRRSRDVCGDAQSAHLAQCSATQASRTNTHQQKDFALQSPSNPKRATRSGVKEKNGISAEGRAKRVMPDFFFHSATRCATRATFQYQAKGDSFF